METVGKILNITLLTVFGAAAATTYLVDSSFLSSLLNSPPTTCSSDKNYTKECVNYSDISVYRERHKNEYMEVERNSYSAEISSENKAVWGQKYGAYPSSFKQESSRVSMLAESNSYEEIRENMEYRDKQFIQAVRTGRSSDAALVHQNYMEFRKALGIKRSARQQSPLTQQDSNKSILKR